MHRMFMYFVKNPTSSRNINEHAHMWENESHPNSTLVFLDS